MQALIYITQLPEYRAQLLRHIDVLEVAEGFTPQEKADLLNIYNALLNKIDSILAQDIEVNNPATV